MGVDNIDYTKKENQTFKNWFVFCTITNKHIPFALLGLVLTALQITKAATVYDWLMGAFADGTFSGVFTSMFLPVPFLIFFFAAFLGCYKHWKLVCKK